VDPLNSSVLNALEQHNFIAIKITNTKTFFSKYQTFNISHGPPNLHYVAAMAHARDNEVAFECDSCKPLERHSQVTTTVTRLSRNFAFSPRLLVSFSPTHITSCSFPSPTSRVNDAISTAKQNCDGIKFGVLGDPLGRSYRLVHDACGWLALASRSSSPL